MVIGFCGGNDVNERQITDLNIKGFKSIREASIKFGMINVFIGANGAGKSNLISVFKLLQNLIDERLQIYVSQQGAPDALLHFGRKTTEAIEVRFTFGNNGYYFRLIPTLDNKLIFENESFYWNVRGDYSLGQGHLESKWKKGVNNHINEYIWPILKNQNWRVYHFHDTSESALVKQYGNINDNAFLAPDARNLAAFLYRLNSVDLDCYTLIKDTIRLVAPFFDDFVLRENPFMNGMIQLEWKDVNDTSIFNASQMSDGTLRFICLATLLLQPEKLQPETILLDEPELGLHPFAITVLAGMIKKAAYKKQIVLSTQSVELLNEFEPNDIVVVEHKGNNTQFTRQSEKKLRGWIEDDYSLGEIWKTNLIGGRP